LARYNHSLVRVTLLALAVLASLLCLGGCSSVRPTTMHRPHDVLTYEIPQDAELQATLDRIDSSLRARFNMTTQQTAVGVLDLKRRKLAMLRPDQIDYAASVPKIGILLAWFQSHPEAATNLDATTRRELGEMIKSSSNEMAAKYSQQLGLKSIQEVLNSYGFYDANRGGGIWVGKHYGQSSERYGDPIANHSHAATVRQLLRFYQLLAEDRLVSAAASRTMREIFASPDIAHLDDKFVKGLAGCDVEIMRKSGWWEDWFHDTAIVTGPDRHYIIVAMTHHPRGEEYLVEFARAIDDALTPVERGSPEP
jgi:beta-lactamase class A